MFNTNRILQLRTSSASQQLGQNVILLGTLNDVTNTLLFQALLTKIFPKMDLSWDFMTTCAIRLNTWYLVVSI